MKTNGKESRVSELADARNKAPEAVGPAGLLRLLFHLRRGTAGRRGVTVLHDVERVVVRCDAPMPLQVDGEDVGDVEEAVFEAEPAAVEVFAPGGGG